MVFAFRPSREDWLTLANLPVLPHLNSPDNVIGIIPGTVRPKRDRPSDELSPIKY